MSVRKSKYQFLHLLYNTDSLTRELTIVYSFSKSGILNRGAVTYFIIKRIKLYNNFNYFEVFILVYVYVCLCTVLHPKLSLYNKLYIKFLSTKYIKYFGQKRGMALAVQKRF